jgi:hypothetical protein
MSVEVGNFLLDLVNIEVNTIIKSGMTAEKMPEPELAVHDVLLEYARYLEQEEEEAARSELTGLAKGFVREGFALAGVRDEIALLVTRAAAQRERVRGTPRQAVLDRIIKNLERLGEIKDLSDLSLRQRLMIRKMWEFGVEEVIVQTCISLDGDVVTRIDPQLLAKPAELREVLLGVHRESTTISVRFWSGLVSVATSIVDGTGKRWFQFWK